MSYRKGLTYEEAYGPKKAERIRLKISQNHANIDGKNNPMYGRKHSKSAKKKISLKLEGNSNAILRNISQHIRRSKAVKKGYIDNPELRDVRSKHFKKINQGPNHPNWKGGKYKYELYGRHRVWQFIRRFIRERDDYTCQNPYCGVTEFELGKELSVHHIESIVDYPHLRYKPSNMISYCHSCHMVEERNQ